ncbi:MAG: excinuclease ABC subunit UvrB [Patescibacteria group bacterium]|nr:excinuclease ABC subunit UvrB [Patescibacteria group bacterium]
MNEKFDLISAFSPTGDQPQAIQKLTEGINRGMKYQTLLGATGTGKTFTMANVIAKVQKPTLVLAHNKTLAAQLASEFRDFFPSNAVEYFVSYYDYYQPEAYVPHKDLYIEKDSAINEEIDRLRLATTKALLTRKDVVIVASVSCIYNIGSPNSYQNSTVILKVGDLCNRTEILKNLNNLQYERNDLDFKRGTFRVKGDILDIFPAYEEQGIRINLFGNQIEKISVINPINGENLNNLTETTIFPARHFVMPSESTIKPIKEIEKELNESVKDFKRQGKLLEAQRLDERTKYDLEMIQQLGYCNGIENYSRYFDGRKPGEAPYTLLDYFPKDYLLFVDESHMTIPQVRGMWAGEKSRKQTLIDFGFRLPSAMDNRPLRYEEFVRKLGQVVFVSATPEEYEISLSSQVVEQIIRPTGLIDPKILIRPQNGQIKDLIREIEVRTNQGERVLITTLTKRMAEELSTYLGEDGIKVMYLHSDIDTLERITILRDLRLGVYDVVVGINLLREGLDLPEVSLVAILDADKEGFLRSKTSLIQTIGRAARHVNGQVIMYADVMTKSIQVAAEETNRRRKIQLDYNKKYHITPTSIKKAVKDIGDRIKELQPEASTTEEFDLTKIPKDEIHRLIKDLEKQMKQAVQTLEFEKAALLRDQILELKKEKA